MPMCCGGMSCASNTSSCPQIPNWDTVLKMGSYSQNRRRSSYDEMLTHRLETRRRECLKRTSSSEDAGEERGRPGSTRVQECVLSAPVGCGWCSDTTCPGQGGLGELLLFSSFPRQTHGH